MSDTPKSTYEIVMERLRRKDQEAGVEARQLNDEQKARDMDRFARDRDAKIRKTRAGT